MRRWRAAFVAVEMTRALQNAAFGRIVFLHNSGAYSAAPPGARAAFRAADCGGTGGKAACVRVLAAPKRVVCPAASSEDMNRRREFAGHEFAAFCETGNKTGVEKAAAARDPL